MIHKCKISFRDSGAPFVCLGLGLLFFLSACASDPILSPVNLQGGQAGGPTTPPGTPTPPFDESNQRDFGHPHHEVCSSGDSGYQYFELSVDSVSASNVIFLLDDSGSMGPLIEKVMDQMDSLIEGLLDRIEDGDSLRIGLIFDPDKAAFNSIDDIQDPDGEIPGSHNPLVLRALKDPRIHFFKAETGSKWIDRAFFQVFGQTNHLQDLPTFIPLDQPAGNAAVKTISDCNQTGSYFRPRVYPYWAGLTGLASFTQENSWPWSFANNWNYDPCVASLRRVDISGQSETGDNLFIQGAPLNLIALSDDDLNVNFDRHLFHPYDEHSNSYPEIADRMFRQFAQKLNTSYRYHSIINKDAALINQLGFLWQEVGIGHWALSQATGGGVYNIQEDTYDEIFQDLLDQIVLSSQSQSLACPAQPNSVLVYRNQVLMPENSYYLSLIDQRLEFKPAFFEGLNPKEKVEVWIQYQVE
ncbi:MAG: VWA domain-containing protein [Bradymonadales bacterium]|nr:MAG: VWA domain-containing protein [Bradymonadales bacterium]